MKITVRYFAMLREQANRSEETLEVPEGMTAESLNRELQSKYGFSMGVSDLKVAVDDSFAPFSQTLRNQQSVVFIPPVAGG